MPGKPGELQRSRQDFIVFQDFEKLNTKSLRQALKEQELSWIENLQQIAPNNLTTVPAPLAALAKILESFTSLFYADIGGTDTIIGFTSAGAGFSVNVSTGSVNNFVPDGTFSAAPDVTTWQASRVLINDATAGYCTFDGTTFVQQGGVSPVITITDGGTGYITAPSVTISGGSGAGATGISAIQNGSVVSVTLTNPGTGFNATDVLTVAFGGTVITTTWAPSAALNANQAGIELYSYRQEVNTLTATGSLLRVTFNASSASSFTAAHCSVAKANVAAPPNTDSAPVELLFSQKSGFTIAAGATIVSDWLDFAVSAGDRLVIVIDFGSTGGNARINLGAGETNANMFRLAATASYQLANVAGFASFAGDCIAISLIETANHGGTGTGATGHVTMTGKPVASVAITNQGIGTALQTPTRNAVVPLIFTGGGGINAAGTATISSGFPNWNVLSVTITNNGSGYTSPPAVTITNNWGTPPVFLAILGTESVATIVLDTGGSGYGAVAPSVAIVGGGTSTPATAHATVAAGAVNALILDSGGSGYISTPTVVIGGGGANVAVAFAHVWPFVPAGTTLAVFQGRVWLAGARLLQWTGTAGFDDFSSANASGSLTISDADLVHSITALRNFNNYLYIMGDRSVKQIGNISIGGSSSNITLFTILTLSSDQGTTFPLACISYNRVFLFANRNGVYAVVGATVQKISDDLDGIFKLVDFTQTVCSALVDINDIHNVAFLVRYKDPLTTTRSLMLAFNGKSWFTLSQGDGLTAICDAAQATGQTLTFGTSGTDVTQLLGDPATAVSWKLQTSLTTHGNPIQRKKVIRAGFAVKTAAASSLAMAIDTENGSQTYAMGLASGFQSIGGAIDGNGKAIEGSGKYLGMTLSGSHAGLTLTNAAIEYQEQALWGQGATALPPALVFNTLSPSDHGPAITLTGNHLTVTSLASGNDTGGRSVLSKTAGLIYFEVTYNSVLFNAAPVFGVASAAAFFVDPGGGHDFSEDGTHGALAAFNSGQVFFNGSAIGSMPGGDFLSTPGVIVAYALDLNHFKIWFRLKNPAGSFSAWTNGTTTVGQDPGANAGGLDISAVFSASVPCFAAYGFNSPAGDTFTVNFGATAFVGLLPNGFAGWTQ